MMNNMMDNNYNTSSSNYSFQTHMKQTFKITFVLTN